jgi:pyridoxamine 5'-phosphate oxidase
MVASAVPMSEVPAALSDDVIDPDPIKQFAAWFADARGSGEPLPEAMTLATATCDGRPTARMVLLKGFDARGFGFFTNYESGKGRDLAENPRAALVLYWSRLGRQVRISGDVVKQTREESATYFHSRPILSQLSAAVSQQSEVIASRAVLEEGVAALKARYLDGDVPLPATWGGYRVVPTTIEFWVHRDSRLHDRIRYTRTPPGWRIERLSP